MELNKSYITLEIKDQNKNTFEHIKKSIVKIIAQNDIEFTWQPHITLDFIWTTTLDSALQKLQWLKSKLKNNIIADINTLHIGKIKSFVSNSNGRNIFYLEIIWWNIFFDFLQKNWYSIEIPHISIFEMNHQHSTYTIERIVRELNNDQELNSHIQNILINTEDIYLKNKPIHKQAEIIDILKLEKDSSAKERNDMEPIERVDFCKERMRKIIDGAKESIQEELSRKANNWTSCFKTVSEQIDCNRYLIEKYIDKNEYNEIDKKIEELKKEIWDLWEIYTERDQEPSEDEKTRLFQHLAEIKEMIEE